MSKKKTQPLFTLVFDDIVRSPDLSSTDLRLYMVMLSYCPKTRTDGVKVCRLTKPVMASILRISERAIYTTLRRLQALELIDITYFENDERKPIYSVMTGPRPDMSPDNLKGTRLATALAYVEDAGGSKNLRRRKLQPRMKDEKRTGHPEAFTNGFTLEEPEVVPGDDLVDALTEKAETSEPPQLPEKSSPTAPPYGTGVPHPMEAEFHSYGSGVPQVWKPSSIPYGTGVPHPVEAEFSPYKSTEQSTSEIPNGMKSSGDYRHLALPHLSAAGLARPPAGVRTELVDSEFRRDIKNDLEDDLTMGMSKEQLAAERARRAAKREGTRETIKDVAYPEKGTPKGGEEAEVSKGRRGAGVPPSGKDSTQNVIERHFTPRPSTVTKVPDSPWGLYAHFCLVVRERYPDVRISAADKRYLMWAKELVDTKNVQDLYEMIDVLVYDYENIRPSGLFLKFAKAVPTPTFEQLYHNVDTLMTLIGVGILAPPSVRYSAYAERFNKRHVKPAPVEGSGDITDPGKTEIEMLEALRDQINGPKA